MRIDKIKDENEQNNDNNQVGMAVLKSNQTRVVYRDNQHIRIVHPYARFLSSYNLSSIGE